MGFPRKLNLSQRYVSQFGFTQKLTSATFMTKLYKTLLLQEIKNHAIVVFFNLFLPSTDQNSRKPIHKMTRSFHQFSVATRWFHQKAFRHNGLALQTRSRLISKFHFDQQTNLKAIQVNIISKESSRICCIYSRHLIW